jgi:hypothetical protein
MSAPSQRDELIKKFKGEVDQADWEMLEPHHEREVLYNVDTSLSIFNVAADLALDDVSAVKAYLDKGLLCKTSSKDRDKFSADKNKFFANFIVVQPYVLFQTYSAS